MMFEIEEVGGGVLRLRGSFDHEHAAVFGEQLRFDVEQQLVANAAALLGGIDRDPIEIIRAVGHGGRPKTHVAVDAVLRVNGTGKAIIFLLGLIEIDVDQLERDADLNRREPVRCFQERCDARAVFAPQAADSHLLLLVARLRQ